MGTKDLCSNLKEYAYWRERCHIAGAWTVENYNKQDIDLDQSNTMFSQTFTHDTMIQWLPLYMETMTKWYTKTGTKFSRFHVCHGKSWFSRDSENIGTLPSPLKTKPWLTFLESGIFRSPAQRHKQHVHLTFLVGGSFKGGLSASPLWGHIRYC